MNSQILNIDKDLSDSSYNDHHSDDRHSDNEHIDNEYIDNKHSDNHDERSTSLLPTLPASFGSLLERAFGTSDKNLIKSEQARLSSRYRDPEGAEKLKQRIENQYQRLSYLATRVPATYAACHSVFSRLAAYDVTFSSFLDIGAGPGTASICVKYIFPELETINLIDQDKSFKIFAESFLSASYFTKTNIQYQLYDLKTVKAFSGHDLICMSYSLNELTDENAQHIVHQAWLATKKALVIIEPGTPRAFQNLKKRRAELINYGARILAPCPHDQACPLRDDDWCHFSVRVERSSLHKYIKDASLSYEDEKFSYLIAIKEKALEGTVERAPNRIIKNPQRPAGHQIFDLCTPNGLQRKTITKANKTDYKIAKKLEWGDCLEPVSDPDTK